MTHNRISRIGFWLFLLPIVTSCGSVLPYLEPDGPSRERQAQMTTMQTGQWYRVCLGSMAFARANPQSSAGVVGTFQSNDAFWIQQISPDMLWVFANGQDNTVRGWIPAEFVCDYWQSGGGTVPNPNPNPNPNPGRVNPPVGGCDPAVHACGPFSDGLRKACRVFDGGQTCNTDRWDKTFFEQVKPFEFSGSWNIKIARYYSVKSNYQKVSDDVKSWYPAHTSNGCVAFMSTAMRHVGIDVPKGRQLAGGDISLWVPGFTKYLEREKQWLKISKADQLQPGDVVITNNQDHTFMFQHWTDISKGKAMSIDNRGFSHDRLLLGDPTGNFTPFGWAWRSPD